jgi:hypothetical protein
MNHIPTLIALALLSLPALAKSPLPPNTPVPDLTREIVEDLKDTYHLGPTGARGWIHKTGSYASPDDFEGFFSTAAARQILITAVAEGSPADGILAPGDVILGIGTTPFTTDARRALADAINEAEREENAGRLQLLRWRTGHTETITLQLQILGTFSHTAPYDCPKSEALIARTKAKILAGKLDDKLHLNALALLATGDADAIDAVRNFLKSSKIASPDLKLTIATGGGLPAWDWGYAGVLLGEYHLLTGDESVLPALREYAITLARGQAICGGWGHNMATLDYNNGRPNARLAGYGTLNQSGIICLMAMVFAEKCGIHEPEITAAIRRAADFYGYFAHKGCIPYGHDQPFETMIDNNGMSGSAAFTFSLIGDTPRAAFFSRMAVASHGQTEIGHTGPFFGAFWTPLASHLAGPDAAAQFFQQHRWLQTLARRWDDGFAYQPPGGRFGGSNDKYNNVSSDGAYLLYYAAPRRKIHLTGKNADPTLALTPEAAREAVHISLADFPAQPDAALLDLLGHPLPMARRRAADALASRDPAMLAKIVSLLENNDPAARIGACHAIAARGEAAASAAPALVALIENPAEDPWLRGRALVALRTLGPPTPATVEALLRTSLAENPADPRRDLYIDLAVTLARLVPDPYAMSIDRELLHRAVNRLLEHPHHVARASAMRLISAIPLEHLHAVAENLIEVIRNDNPLYQTYHHDAPRATGLAILERLNIRDGIDLAITTMEPDKWGQKYRIYGKTGRLALLARYGTAAQSILPQLEEMRANRKLNDAADEALQAIRTSTTARELIALSEIPRE